jgi:hypothetical protein
MNELLDIVTQLQVKDLLLLAIGAGASAFLKYLPAFISNYRRLTPLLGTWHAYHWTRASGTPFFSRSTWVFRRRLYGLRLESTKADKDADLCRGVVTFDGDDIILNLKGVDHSEHIHYRLLEPIPYADAKLVGLSLATDYDRKKYSTVQLCVRKERTEQEAKDLIPEYADICKDEAAVRIKSSKG